MQLTKTKENEILKGYNTWMNAYLNADPDTYDSYFDDAYHFIGSTNNEEFLNRKDTTEFFKVTGDQFAGLMDLRNESKTLEQFNELIFITHFCDVWFLNEDQWSYYGRFRLSSVMKQTDAGWRFIYQHFSMPDSKSDEGQTIGFENVKTENIELKEAIKRRTQELELKNRELEIESALNRIRAEATAMKKSNDLLDVVVTLRTEFIKLGHQAEYFWHMMWLPDKYEKAMTSGDGSKIGMVMELPRDFHSHYEGMSEWENSQEPLMILPLDVEKAVDYVDKMITLGNFQQIDPNAPTLDDIRHIGGITFIMARTTHGEIGYSLSGVVKDIPKTDLDILKRFAGAFDLAHRRFLDLQKAEKQAREVEIELALEKVRSRTMAMQKSEELADVATVLFQQVKALGIEQWTCGFNIWETGDTEFTFYPGGPDGELLPSCKVPLFEHPIFRQFDESRRRGDELLVYEKEGEEQKNHYSYMHSLPGMGDMLQNMLDQGMEFPDYQIDHVANFAYGNIVFITYEPFPEMHNVFKRFAKVFEQTYTRFLDLQKAEVQAREAQIELGLERVRARAMAMQNTNELSDLVGNLLQELTKLDFSLTFCIINIVNEPDNSNMVWAANPEEGKAPESYYMRFEDYPFHHAMMREWKAQTPKFIYVMEGEEKKIYDDYLYTETEFSRFPKEVQTANRALDKYVASFVFSKFGGLQTVGDQPLSDENLDILYRFGKVFDLTYTRFNDLQNAEAQAREAQIEAALERVRAQSMAMHTSDELKDVIRVIFDQMGQININAEHAGIVVDYEPKKDWHFWVAETQDIPAKITIPYNDLIWDRQFTEAKQTGKPLFTTLLNFEEKNAFYKQLLPHIEGLTKEMQDHYFEREGLAISTAIQKDIALYIENFSGIPYTEEENAVLLRFAKVFQQTYTRFLDLQKAEAQAREAQIEAALERVRSRSMAMHKSEEIGEVAKVLFQQLKNLGGDVWASGFGFCEEDSKEDNFWFVTETDVSPNVRIPNTTDPAHKQMYEGWKNKQDYFSIAKDGNELAQHYKYMLTVPDIQPIFKNILDKGIAFPTWQKWHAAYFKYGYLLVITTEEYQDETVFKRFSKVFEQAYTRFLDLQKAEVQSKESKIQLALERVRAKTMAMQHSDELREVVLEMYNQLQQLDFDSQACNIIIIDQNTHDQEYWVSGFSQELYPESYHVPNLKHPYIQQQIKAWEKGKTYEVFEYEGREKKKFDKIFFSKTDFKKSPKEAQEMMRSLESVTLSTAFTKYGSLQVLGPEPLNEEKASILLRFAKVFDQTYTRFLDLKKAEAQAREAQIVASLERVRAATMAMHQSKELSHVLSTLFEQYDILGINPSHAVLTLINKEKNILNFRTTGKNGYQVYAEQEVDLNLVDSWVDTTEKWKKSNPNAVNVNEYPPEVLADVWEVYKDVLNAMPKKARPEIKDFPEGLFITEGYCQYGYIGFAHSRKPTEEEKDIVRRFATEFGTLYQRFLDLKKAEAQAREAEIEAALEKVRSRSLSVHKSDEFNDVVKIVFEKLKELQIPATAVGIGIRIEGSKDLNSYVCGENNNGLVITNYRLPYFKNKISKDLCTAIEKELTFYVGRYTKKVKDSFYEYVLSHTAEFKNLPKDILRMIFESKSYKISMVASKHVVFNINDFEGKDLTEHEIDILKRFSKVFNQAYIRFLDLQKAEAQTREAQIETALEKVRSRTMAMQKGEELKEVVVLLYKELIALGVTNFVTCGYVEINEKTGKQSTWVTHPGGDSLGLFYLPLKGDSIFDKRYNAWKKQQVIFYQSVAGEQRKAHLDYAITTFNSKEAEEMVLNQFPDPTVFYCFNFSHGYLHIVTGSLLKKEEEALLARFTKVFEQTYARFLDLKKAEAQAREAQIEAALERVRSQSMGMQNSLDLGNVTTEMFNQLRNFGEDLFATGIVFCDKHTGYVEQWHSIPSGEMLSPFIVPVDLDYIHQYRYDQWKLGKELFSIEIPSDFIEQHFEDIFNLPSAQIALKDLESRDTPMPAAPPWEIDYGASFKNGYLLISSLKHLKNTDILPRFAKVFEQTYARFLDLQKAEAQARESQIENALEKVRSRTMAMQHSNELPEAANNLFLQVQALGIPAWSAGYCIWEDNQKSASCNMSSEGEIQKRFSLPTIGEGYNFYDPYKNGESFYVAELGGEELVKHYEFMTKLPVVGEIFEGFEKAGISLPIFQIFHIVYFTHGYLMFITYEPVPNDWDIFKRFGKVFEQTFTRFLDLQKAEAQTREAQISLAVERVRAKALAMHKSEEIIEVVAKLKDEVMSLDIPDVVAATIFLNEGDDKVRMWDLSSIEKNDEGYQTHLDITFKFKKTDPHLYVKRVWENPANYFTEIQEGKDFKRIIAWLRENKKTQVADDVEAFTEKIQLQRLYHVVKKLNNGKLAIDLLNPPSAEMETILTKMGAAFDLAYKRFEDLQKAEAQAREAQIENALEKVRSRSLTMNKPDELQEVVIVVAEKLQELGVIFDVGGVVLCTYFPDNKNVIHWIASPDLSSSQGYFVPYFDNPIFNDAWDSKDRGDAFFSKEFPTEAKNHFFEYAFEHSDYKHFPDDYKQHVRQAEKHHLSAAWSKNSAILIPSLTGVVPSESDADIMKRFAKVFEQAYIRFMDLQKAEAQARESQIEAALERVRARALAMHNPEELKEVSHVLRTEMGLLGVEELETSSIYINEDTTEKTECWYAIKDIRSKKQKLVNDHFELDLNATWVGRKMLKFYNSKNERVSIKMAGNNRKEWIDYCEERSAPLKGYYGKNIPDRTYHLHKFSHGAIGVATAGDISDENWNLLKRAALVFSLAYSRFKDLTQARIDLAKLKEEKKRAEEALAELQTTQKQLIQSEKMASLGELTAGIAHEIQNPLNFVNNFSEVSKELLDEMLEEIENGDFDEVKAIMEDVIQNLEKINHHGKRADGIVKGMLQHSRASGDKKEPTDINALADEYLRLAYHGLRAKDKSFNAELVTNFDDSIDTIKIIPQDVGRVILNLLTNAFYVVNEKKKKEVDDYSPRVSISTKKKKGFIEVIVTDNGNGIPDTVKEKIFQPFFTTKPTGEGTGLGLSLSYDIITKGHGGDLKVDTKEGEGTTFKIELPYK